MTWDLSDIDAGFCFDRFDTKVEALRCVATLLENNGGDYADVLELGTPDVHSGASNLTGAALVAASKSILAIRAGPLRYALTNSPPSTGSRAPVTQAASSEAR